MIGLILIPLCLYFYFGLQHLTQFETADEHYWFGDVETGRIYKYWNAISHGNWAGTRINDKPGVTLAYICGIGTIVDSTSFNEPDDGDSVSNSSDIANTLHDNFVFRLPILIFNGLFSFFFFWGIRRVTRKKWIAIFATTLILLNPVLLGVSQIVNPDALLWTFVFSSFLCFYLFLEERRKKDAVLAAIFFGLALLSKYTAIIFIPFYFVMVLIHLLFESESWSMEELRKNIIRFILGYFCVVFGAFLLFALLMPAVIVSPYFFYDSVVGFKGMFPIFANVVVYGILIFLDAIIFQSKYADLVIRGLRRYRAIFLKIIFAVLFLWLFLALLNWSVGDNIMNIKGLAFDVDKSIFKKQGVLDKIFLESYPLVFSLTPLVLFFIFFTLVRAFFKKSKFPKLIFTISVFVLSFYGAVFKQNLLSTIRYTIILYPFLMLLASIGIWEFLQILLARKKNKQVLYISYFAIVFISSVSIYLIKPFYFNYTSDLLPKSRQITGAWGYGGYEAAQKLNALPDSDTLTVWTDYWGFCSFFKGRCIRMAAIDSVDRNTIDRIDYYVVTRRGKALNNALWEKMEKASIGTPIWRLEIDSRPKNFIEIYKPKDNILKIKKADSD